MTEVKKDSRAIPRNAEVRVANVHDMWIHANKPRSERLTIRTQTECSRRKCINLLAPSVFDPEDPDGKVKFYHMDIKLVNTEEVYPDPDDPTKPYLVKRKMWSTYQHLRRRHRLLCKGCRQAVYCCKTCRDVDLINHKIECKMVKADILQRVIMEDSKGVQELIDKDPTLALKVYTAKITKVNAKGEEVRPVQAPVDHSILSFAVAIGYKPVIDILFDALKSVSQIPEDEQKEWNEMISKFESLQVKPESTTTVTLDKSSAMQATDKENLDPIATIATEAKEATRAEAEEQLPQESCVSPQTSTSSSEPALEEQKKPEPRNWYLQGTVSQSENA